MVFQRLYVEVKMLEYVGYVDRGLVHKTNDDAALLKHSVIHEGFFRGKCQEEDGIFAVADGVGSVNCSELASRYALSEARECGAGDIDGIKECICKINYGLLELTKWYQLRDVLSTTLCMVSVTETKVVSFNLGNSRLYRFRNGYLRQMTKDQTKVQNLIDMGLLDPHKADEHPEKNVINQFLGSEVFRKDWLDIKEHVETFEKNDVLLLCSDGIHEYVDIRLIEEILSVEGTLEEQAKIMMRCAEDAGGKDNATVVLIKKL